MLTLVQDELVSSFGKICLYFQVPASGFRCFRKSIRIDCPRALLEFSGEENNIGNSGVPISSSKYPSVPPHKVEESVERNGGMGIYRGKAL